MYSARCPSYNILMTIKTVQPDSYLTLNYRLVLPGGEDYINTFEDNPATVMFGTGQFAPCFEKALLGLKNGERRTVVIPPEEGFGLHKPELVQWVTMETLKENNGEAISFSPGDVIEFNAPSGAQYAGVLQSITEEGAWFDFNHPLAGKSITFEAEIVGIM
jgi:FKBP-type peptidyl-prolyl cis-trans isomerase SlpA